MTSLKTKFKREVLLVLDAKKGKRKRERKGHMGWNFNKQDE